MMATADSVKEKIQVLIEKANDATGNTDTDLTLAIDALVAGFGQGGIPGVTVVQGEYICGSSGSIASAIKLIHNLGAIKPFWLHMKAHNDHMDDATYNTVHSLTVAVSPIEGYNVTYGTEYTESEIPPSACTAVRLYDGTVIGGSNTPEFYDSEISTQANYKPKMWPDGFTCGLYRNMVLGETYDYTLIYGDLFGGTQ